MDDTNNKLSTHIDAVTVIQWAVKQVSFLRKLKYKFSKDTWNIKFIALKSGPYWNMRVKFGMVVTS